MKRYNPSEIEPKWQKIWDEEKISDAEDFAKKPKFVMLTEFPYPSGAGLHMGHLREYTLGDVIARSKRMQGFNVLFPMGFDAFGLPTENYAIKNKISPQKATADNVKSFRETLSMMGYSIDWSRSFATSDPDYYRWTQWMFLQFFKKGLAYQDESAINWCPFCKTGLANEEVVNGRHERCDTLVEKKVLRQWMLRITDYAEQLIDGLSEVDFPPRIANQQINWIGKSVGAEVNFEIAPQEDKQFAKSPENSNENSRKIRVFTTRPDTIFGVTFMVLAPEHELVAAITTEKQREKVDEYLKIAASKSDLERQENHAKTGVFTGSFAKNPLTNEKIPIFVADYVLPGYGTGAIMAVPAHDARDREFAEKFDLEIKSVIVDETGDEFSANLGKLQNSGEFSGMDSETAKNEIIAKLERENLGQKKTNYKLRDWVYSRQHYWGEPIPIIYCEKCGTVAVPEEDLPVELPKVDHYEPTDDGKSPLSRMTDWVNVACPQCGRPARRETDTMPNWAGSNWYYLRYFDAKNSTQFAAPENLDYWGQVDLYLGGMEHTTLHLLYSRFHHQFLYNQGLVPFREPYAARRGQGIILAADGQKMSKSKGNVVDPRQLIASGYGADAARLAVTFLAPYDQTTPWSPEGVAGCYRFLGRVWNLAEKIRENMPKAAILSDESKNPSEKSDKAALKIIHTAIKKVSDDIAKMNFNTAIAALMEAANGLSKIDSAKIAAQDFAKFVQLLAPFTPHIAEEIWREIFGKKTSVHLSTWPEVEEEYLVSEKVTVAVTVNGRKRGEILIAPNADEATAKKVALEQENVAKFASEKNLARVIYVPGKILNLVVK